MMSGFIGGEYGIAALCFAFVALPDACRPNAHCIHVAEPVSADTQRVSDFPLSKFRILKIH